MQVILVLFLALALLIAVFALQNQAMVDIRLLFWEISVSKILVILGSALAGALAVLLAGLFRRRTREGKAKGKAGGGACAGTGSEARAAGSMAADRLPDKKDG